MYQISLDWLDKNGYSYDDRYRIYGEDMNYWPDEFVERLLSESMDISEIPDCTGENIVSVCDIEAFCA